jgi:iron(III) transport system permease protein
VLALAVRRLAYALRACYASLQQISISLEEAAENLGATKLRSARKILLPLMAGAFWRGSSPVLQRRRWSFLPP